MVTTQQQAALEEVRDTLKPDVDGIVAYFVRISELCEEGLTLREAYEVADREADDE